MYDKQIRHTQSRKTGMSSIKKYNPELSALNSISFINEMNRSGLLFIPAYGLITVESYNRNVLQSIMQSCRDFRELTFSL